MIDSCTKKLITDTGPCAARGARSGILGLTAGLGFALSAGATAANAGDLERAMKHTGHHAHGSLGGAQVRRAHGERGERRHGHPGTAVGCGDVLSEAGNYALNSDLVCTSPIKITGSNVHLDLAGHSISCAAASWAYSNPPSATIRYPQIVTAIFVNADSAIEWEESGSGLAGIPDAPVLAGFKVKNGTITGCSFGMYFFRTDRSMATNMHLEGNNVERPEFFDASAGITTLSSNDNDFISNHVSGSLSGFELALSDGNRLNGNVLQGNYDSGVLMNGSRNNVLRQNNVVGNPYGIYVQSIFIEDTSYEATGNVIASNIVSGNEFEGITLVAHANGNVVRANAVTDNGGVGVLLLGFAPEGLPVPADNTVQKNIATGNSFGDLAEVDLDENYQIVIPSECSNTWKHNTFVTSFGPEGCIK